MITISINVSKIDKAHLIKGAKGTYLDLVMFENEELDRFGNKFVVLQSVSKEARLAGTKGAILGNGKLIERQAHPAATPPRPAPRPAAPAPAPTSQDPDDDVPF